MDLPEEWIETAREAACRAAHPTRWQYRALSTPCDVCEVSGPAVLAAVAPLIAAQAHREGYETARADMVSGAFISGPTYEAVRDSFTGRQVAAQALRDAAEEWGDRVDNAKGWLLDTADVIERSES